MPHKWHCHSVFIYTTLDDLLLFSTGTLVSTVEEEMLYNPRLTLSRDKFIDFMKNLKLDLPKMIGKSNTYLNCLLFSAFIV